MEERSEERKQRSASNRIFSSSVRLRSKSLFCFSPFLRFFQSKKSHAAPRSQLASLSGARSSYGSSRCSSLNQQGCPTSGIPAPQQQAFSPQRCNRRICARRRCRRDRRGDRGEDPRDQSPAARLSLRHGAGPLRLERGKKVLQGRREKERSKKTGKKKRRPTTCLPSFLVKLTPRFPRSALHLSLGPRRDQRAHHRPGGSQRRRAPRQQRR